MAIFIKELTAVLKDQTNFLPFWTMSTKKFTKINERYLP